MSEVKLQPIIQCAPCNREREEQHHLRWFLFDQEAGCAIAKEDPAVADLSLEVRFGYLVLRAPGMLRLDIPMDVLEDEEEAFERVTLAPLVPGKEVRAVTEGDLAQAWLSTYFDRPVRLLKLHPDESSPV